MCSPTNLYAFESDPGLVGGPVEAAMLHHLSEEADDALCAVLVHVRQVVPPPPLTCMRSSLIQVWSEVL